MAVEKNTKGLIDHSRRRSMGAILFASSLAIVAMPLFALAVPGRGFWGPILMLGGLIFVHELGHFLAAKFIGMPIDVFSIGFGPRLCGFKWKETDIRLAALPLGGYVKLAGYNPEDPGADDPYGFLKQPAWKRLTFYSGGIVANVIACAVLIYTINVGRERYPILAVKIEVQEGSAAAKGGFVSGDKLLSLGTLELPQARWNEDIVPYIRRHADRTLEATVMRDGQSLIFSVTPDNRGGEGFLGITAERVMGETPSRPLRLNDFVSAVPNSIDGTIFLGGMVANGFWRLISFQANVKELGGPIAIVQIGSKAAKSGWEEYLFMTAFISMNLAILNALPIPFLDGGHICILAFERLRRRDISIQVKEKILAVGFYFMVSLMVLVVFMDLWRLKK